MPGVVGVTTLMTGSMNVYVTAAAPDKQTITDIAYRLDEVGLSIDREHLIWKQESDPYTGFQFEGND
ncbi:hypothetical protein [Natrinema amylolyticum]|uniref:hypothetical protein n=1 Tax=Natrinema amylolyticum TaxID=2878679 RepID=UPI001CFB2E11|nr:hypothetical protein [Natrinema amylolyticum]